MTSRERVLDVMMPGGGFVAMFDAVKEFGIY
jgi:hypothetical protein